MKAKTKSKSKLDMRITLILFALLPMICAATILSIILVNTSTSELKSSTYNAMVSTIEGTGQAFDYSTVQNENVLINFIQAPIVKEFLRNQDDEELLAKAQQYTMDFYNSLDGWEGIYISNWDTVCLTHPVPAVVGKQFREGDYRQELWDGMKNAENGVYNVGIITSPASGQLIMSMYAPVYDDDGTPLGYVGAGTFVNNIASKFTDVSSLGLQSAYIYFVDSTGVMLYHPDESKIGNMAENEAVKTLVQRLGNGETIVPGCVEYLYKGSMKYAAYYVGRDSAYIAVLAADEADAMEDISKVTTMAIIIAIASVVIFTIVAILVSRVISIPLAKIADATARLSTGDVTVECDAKSHIKETVSIIDAFEKLKDSLSSSMTNVRNSASMLNTAIVSVDDMTANNVESITQISTAIDEVASTSQSVAEDAQIMAEKAVELGQNIDTLNDNVARLHDASVVIRTANNEATGCMQSVYKGANESVNAVNDISAKISETNDAVEEISRAIQAIENIASQTNLLSLNASIEAARAGEAGAGFAVVASEIRNLADESADSAREIREIIQNVVELSNVTVEISQKVYSVICKEQADIEAAQEKFAQLSESVEESLGEIEQIKSMAGMLGEIKEELTSATTDLGAISEELGAASQEVAASCQTVSGACTDTQASTEEMRAVNENMSNAIEFFKLS